VSAREVVREALVSRAVALEWEMEGIRIRILESLGVKEMFGAEEPPTGRPPLSTSDVKSAVAILRMQERLRGIVSQRTVERAVRSLFDVSGQP